MAELPPGWETDLCVLRHSGSVVEDHGDHLVVRSPENPHYHWGNCLFVTDGGAVDDAVRWVETFRTAFPGATWVSIGLVREPDDTSAWLAAGVELELVETLTTRFLPSQSPLADGYAVRQLGGTDWAQSMARSVEENLRTGDYEAQSFALFAERQVQTKRALSDRGVAAFFGAFSDGVLVADLGIVLCGTAARYQSVGTDADHRRRGLAGHLLGVAARWAADRGCERWVIVTEATNPAGRVYRSVGFEPDVGSVQAYRKPPTE